MALSKEFKQYIEKKFEERVKVLKNAQYQETEEARKKLLPIKDAKMKEFRDFVIKFNAELPEGLSVTSTIMNYTGLTNYNYDPIYSFCPKNIGKEIDERCAAIISKLEKEKEYLLIKLSMEKDFDRINDMLKEYGIELG